MRNKGTKVMRISKILKSGALAAAASVALAGCQNTGGDIDDIYVPVASYERFPIEVQKGAVTMELPSGRALSPANKDKLMRFAQMAHSNRASIVIVSRPTGSGSGHAVAEQAEAILIQGGVPAEAISANTHGGGPVLVSYTRTFAVTQACGDWTEDLGENSENTAYNNLGCASQHNLAALVANPEDLVIPETMTPSDPMRRNQVFIDYRTPKSPSTPADTQADAKISEVAM